MFGTQVYHSALEDYPSTNMQKRCLAVNAKYFEIEKYFPTGSKATVIIQQKLYAQPIKTMDLLAKHMKGKPESLKKDFSLTAAKKQPISKTINKSSISPVRSKIFFSLEQKRGAVPKS